VQSKTKDVLLVEILPLQYTKDEGSGVH
jgi:hypothetical protein